MKQHIVLIHGLYMSNLVMQYLKHALASKGFSVSCFGYHTTKYSEKTLDNLHQHIAHEHPQNHDVILVGHSMGGLISRLYVNKYPNTVKKIITLGTPHQGSELAKWVDRFGILGSAGASGIVDPIPEWEGQIPLGSIAGNLCVGLLAHKQEPNDGTVLVSETHCEHETAHVVIPVSHTGLVYSKKVVSLVTEFIHTGTFNHKHD